MSTTVTQRVSIWIIAIVMAIGTIGSFFVIIVANDNNAKQQAKLQELSEKINKEYQAKLDAQNKELSEKYFAVLSQFTDRVGEFNKDDVTELGIVDLLEGDGAVVGDDGVAYSAYYIGWNPDGKIFDQSLDGDKLKSPLPGSTSLIEGWTNGVKGMKIGGARLLTIPAEQAYGDAGSGDLIPPHTPIKFIVLVIPTPATIPMPYMDEYTSLLNQQ